MNIIEFTTLRELDRRAVEQTRTALGPSPDLAGTTPCAGWTLGDLLAHMTVQHRGFAAAARGEVTSVADWAPAPLAADPVADYEAACDVAATAFASVADPGAPMMLPELRREPLPAGIAIGFHLVDTVVHGWDVAAALGGSFACDVDVLAAALRVAQRVPDGAEREREGAAFAHALAVPADASVLERILLLLGRDPRWAAVPSAL